MHDSAAVTPRLDRSGILFAAPWLAGFFILSLAPMAVSAGMSLARWDGLSGRVEYVGTQHYAAILGRDADGRPDPRFVKAVTNTLVST